MLAPERFSRRKLQDSIQEYLRQQIFSGQLKPGALREYYGRLEGPPIASTLDHIVAAVGG
ncbi:MAG: hypothetical protein GEU28_05675 [Dehalococcoidia bacterium]|nr:hypothetical protein [Dehalococcoidia bacterium]